MPKNQNPLKKLCMVEAALICHESGVDAAIDTPKFKTLYMAIYEAVTARKNPPGWKTFTSFEKKSFCEHVLSVVSTNKMLTEDFFKEDLYNLILDNIEQDENGLIHVDELRDALSLAMVDIMSGYIIKEAH